MKNYTVYKQRLCAAALFLFIFFSAFGTANASWDGTTTTPVSPDKNVYKIYTAEQLAWVAKEVNDSAAGTSPFAGSTVALMNDIDLSKPDGSVNLWTPIGLYAENGASFCGTFDGQGYSVANMLVSADAWCHTGFFGYISAGAEVKNLTVKGSVYNASPTKEGWLIAAGCIAGGARGATFKNCHAVGGVTTATDYRVKAGLLVGALDIGCRVENATASGTITTTRPPVSSHTNIIYHYVGGITGTADASSLVNCECSVDIKANTMNATSFDVAAALICGWLRGASFIENARADGAITLSGVAGTADSGEGEIYNCFTNVRISYGDGVSSPCIGGAIGMTTDTSVKNVFANGVCETPTAGAYIGGVCGLGYGGSFENCASAFAAGKYGLVALRLDPTIKNCGWLDSSAENGEGIGYGTFENVASFDAEEMASKIVVAALPQDMRLDMTVGASAEAKLITYPAGGGTGLQHVTLVAAPAGFASVISDAANSFKVTALSVGNVLLSFSAELLPTLFDGDFEKRAEAVDISPAVAMNVKEGSGSSSGCSAGFGGIATLLLAGCSLLLYKKRK